MFAPSGNWQNNYSFDGSVRPHVTVLFIVQKSMAAFHSLVLSVYHRVETGRGRRKGGYLYPFSSRSYRNSAPCPYMVKEPWLYGINLIGDFRGCSDQGITFLSSKKNLIYPVFLHLELNGLNLKVLAPGSWENQILDLSLTFDCSLIFYFL